MRMCALAADDIRESGADDSCVGVGDGCGCSRRGFLRTERSVVKPRRRDSAVTFCLPDEEEEDDEGGSDGNVFSPKDFATARRTHRRMSAPELPPIGGNNAKCKSPASAEQSRVYSRNKNRISTTEGSQKNSNQSRHSLSCESVSSYPAIGNLKTRSSDPSTGGDTGSTTKLQTLYEKNNNDSCVKNLMVTPRTTKSRSVSQDRVRSRVGLTGGNDSELVPLDVYANKPKPFLRRNKSEQKLATSHRKARNSSLLNNAKTTTTTTMITVNSINGFAKPARHRSHVHPHKLKRYCSTPAMNSIQDFSPEQPLDGQTVEAEEAESERERLERIFEWLRGVEFSSAEHPQEPEIDYADEPPQTDTAVHVVYDG